jgi:hypothetical protein
LCVPCASEVAGGPAAGVPGREGAVAGVRAGTTMGRGPVAEGDAAAGFIRGLTVVVAEGGLIALLLAGVEAATVGDAGCAVFGPNVTPPLGGTAG